MINKLVHKIVLGFILAFIFGVGSLQASAQNISINGEVGNGRLEKGKPAVVSVILDIPGELHINSNRPSKAGLIATRLRVTAPGLKIGAISYPRGTMRKFGFSDTPLSVYEGRTVIRFNVTVPPTFKGNAAKIRAVVDYQSCTNEVCYPPRSGDITLSASIR
jgi:hypothetical protein